MKRVVVPLAQGCEEIEAITIIDILRRADIEVVVAGLEEGPVRSSHGVIIFPETLLANIMDDDIDMIALPGGVPGADNLNGSLMVHDLVKRLYVDGKFVAAICAAPIVLAKAGLLAGKRATSYPGFIDRMGIPGVSSTGSPLEWDGQIITSRGAGTAMDFALTLVEALEGKERRLTVESGLKRP